MAEESNELFSPAKAAREWARRRGDKAENSMLIEAWLTGWNARCIPEEPGALADHLRSMLLDGTVQCPLCGKTGPHPHSPEEIVIYRNGVKYGRSLKLASDETAASPGPMPDWAQLLLECRDALPAISLSAARLHGLDLTLADRIERMLEPWRVADDEPARYPAPSPDRKPQESKRE